MKKGNYIIITMLLLLSTGFTALQAQLPLLSNQNIDFSTAIQTVSSGNWSNPSIWSGGVVPDANTDVIISDGHTIYVDVEGSVSGEIVDLCRNLQVNSTAVLQIGHDTPSFAKDLRINGSILCHGTFSSGRNQPGASGDGSIFAYNSRIFMNVTQNNTFISGSGFFNAKALSISSDFSDYDLTIDLYTMVLDENFAIKSNNNVNVTISKYAYVDVKGILGLTGSDYQFSAPTAKSNLTIEGIVVAGDVSLFTKNQTVGETTYLTITNQGSLYSFKVNKAFLDRKAEAAGFNFTIEAGGLWRLGEGVNFENLTTNNPNFVLTNNGEIRKHYSETMPTKAAITSNIDQYDPNLGVDVSEIKDVFGSSHIAGWYNFTTRPFLLEGLDYYKTFGSTVLKTVVSAINGKMYEAYPFNHTWPTFQTIKEVAQHEYIDSLFKRTHIKTHAFWTTTKNKGDYKNGPDFDHASYLNEEQQFYDLTKHLLDTYGDMGKTFVYQNWEGDWMLRGQQGLLWENDPSLIPDDVDWQIEGMARMFRARQRGTERARNEYTTTTSKVFHAIEFNKLWMTSGGNRITMMDNGTPCVIADVIPKTRLDLSSYSAYDSSYTNTDNPEGHSMWKGLEIARYFTTETKAMGTTFPVQIGEFGINENPPYNGSNDETTIRDRYGRYIGVALGLNIPNFYLWNLYCTDQQGPNGFTWQKGEEYDETFLYENMNGKWLIEPDGTWGIAASYLMEQWANTLSNDNFQNEINKIGLYPNPASETIRLSMLQPNALVTIFDMNGRAIGRMVYNKNQEIDVSNFKSGTYIVRIQTENNYIENKKLIIN
ncbi:T9SS type A sorting domain-containing protein [Gaetbulibacter sp. M240]|uniref:T9SS type A sorting domain-containing protein n=1 Tax=Gaetbulibacter sp. M240 TaxID=3126511 RepID=UPI00374FB279